MRRIFACSSFVLLCLSAVAAAQELKEGKEFPPFSEPDVRTGKTIKLADFRGKVVLVDFWATWCPPCRAELPNLKKVYAKHHKAGFEVISISLDKSVEDCKEYIEKQDLDWNHIADGKFWKAKLAAKHGIKSIPQAVLVGKDGKIIALEARGEDLEKFVQKALAAEYAGAKGDAAGVSSAKKPGEAKEADAAAEKDAAKMLQTAQDLAKAKKYAEARQAYQKLIDKHPDTKAGKTAADELAKLPKS